MAELRSPDRVERTAFAAIRLVDGVTGAPVGPGPQVRCDEADILINRSGMIVLRGLRRTVPGVMTEAEASSSEPANRYGLQLARGAAPPFSAPITVEVRDPRGLYLPRRCLLRVVRDPPPAVPTVLDRELFPSPTASPGPGHAVLNVRCVRAGVGVPGVVLAVRRVSDNALLARGLSNDLGDALVLVAGLPVSTWSDTDADGDLDAVTTPDTSVRVAALLDESALNPTTGALRHPVDPDLVPFATSLTRPPAQTATLRPASVTRMTFTF
jgi:hypothetical protein